MGNEQPLSERIRAELARTGYPLEMRVAAAARRHRPLYVNQSRYYLDARTEKIRETDVLVCWMAHRNDGGPVWTSIYLVIECKSKPAPWVIFDANEGLTDDAEMRLDWSVTKEIPRSGLMEGPVTGTAHIADLFAPSRVGTGVVEMFGSKSERNPAWDAVQSAVSAAHGFMHDVDEREAVLTGGQACILVQPVVITSGELFRAFLDANEEVQVEEVARGELTVRHSEEASLTRCLVVRESYVPQLMELAVATAVVFGRL